MPRTAALLCLGLILVVTAPAESRHDKFQHEMTERLRKGHAQLKLMRVSYESEPGYLLAEDAYRHALDDLEDFGHDAVITEERLRNDVREFEFDLHELSDSLAGVVVGAAH